MKNELFALPEAVAPTGNRRDERSNITNIVGILFFCLTGHLPRLLRDEQELAPHHRNGYKMQQVLPGDSRWQQVESLFDVGFHAHIDLAAKPSSIVSNARRLRSMAVWRTQCFGIRRQQLDAHGRSF